MNFISAEVRGYSLQLKMSKFYVSFHTLFALLCTQVYQHLLYTLMHPRNISLICLTHQLESGVLVPGWCSAHYPMLQNGFIKIHPSLSPFKQAVWKPLLPKEPGTTPWPQIWITKKGHTCTSANEVRVVSAVDREAGTEAALPQTWNANLGRLAGLPKCSTQSHENWLKGKQQPIRKGRSDHRGRMWTRPFTADEARVWTGAWFTRFCLFQSLKDPKIIDSTKLVYGELNIKYMMTYHILNIRNGWEILPSRRQGSLIVAPHHIIGDRGASLDSTMLMHRCWKNKWGFWARDCSKEEWK